MGRPRKYLVNELGTGQGQGHRGPGAERTKLVRERAKALGLCQWGGCKNPSRPGKTMCQEHSEYYKRRHENNKAAGLCWKCGGERDLPGKSTCKKCVEKIFLYSLGRFYNMTPVAYMQMLADQDYKCFVCKSEFDLEKKTKALAPHVDHDHSNGKVRAILCGNCNTMLGLAKEDTDVLKNAILYIEYWRRELGQQRED